MLRWRRSWTIENLQGSIRRDLEPSERSVWADLLDLCALSRRWGIIERSQGIPYTYDELAQMFVTPVEVVRAAVSKCLAEGRLQQGETGELIVTNWDKYQPQKDKKTANNQIPLMPEDRKAGQQAAAARLGYLHPEAAKRGAETREHEEAMKKALSEAKRFGQEGKGESDEA